MKKVAITGSIASGKSTVCSFFRSFGAYVVSSDLILHKAFDQNAALQSLLVSILGSSIIENGKISRQRVAEIVFENRSLLDAVERVCHEYLFSELCREFALASHGQAKASLFVAEVPLLYESAHPKLASWFDYVVYVSASPEVCRNRYTLQRQSSNENKLENELQKKRAQDFHKRSLRLLSPEEKRKKADFCIENSETLQILENRCAQIYQQLCR